MPISPNQQADGVVSVAVRCAGSPLPDDAQLLRIVVRRAIGQVAGAQLELADGDMPGGRWPLADAATLLPGTAIEIDAGYAQQNETLFKGVVVKMSVRIGENNRSLLVIDCRDDAVSMTLNRRSAVQVDKTDSDVMASLAGDHGLSTDIAATSLQHRELVQFQATDWDFLLARAEANGLLVHTDDGTLRVQPPQTSAQPALEVTWGADLIAFQAEMDARLQAGSVSASSWDPAQQALAKASEAAPQPLNTQGNVTAQTLAGVLPKQGKRRLQAGGAVGAGELTAWAKAEQQRAGLARLRGSLRFQGNATPRPNQLLKVAGVGERFDGNLFIARVEHELVDGNWITEVGFGLDPEWFCARPDVSAPPNGARLPGCSGLQVGVVVKLDADPDGALRVQIKLPVLEATPTELLWARLLQPYASNGFGFFFWPEVNDEVLVGFFDEDPSHPVVLGSLYSSKHKAEPEPAAQNNTKSIVTRSKLKMVFDEEKKSILLTTPGGNKALLDDEGKQIQLSDQNGNKITMNESGIKIESPKDIVLDAKGSIKGTALNTVELKATADLKAEGLNVSCTGQVGFTAKGNASAELSAAGQTTVKGAMVMIN